MHALFLNIKVSGKKRVLFTLMLLLFITYAKSSTPNTFDFTITVLNEELKPADGATVELLKNGKLIKVEITDTNGMAVFHEIIGGDYTFTATYTGYIPQNTSVFHFPGDANKATITLKPASNSLKEVSITANKPIIEQSQGKVIINVDASITNIGSTVLEVLEKSPGVTVDSNGGISLRGRTPVLVTIDDKPTYLSGDVLKTLLSSMNSTEVAQIELIPTPAAKYDASGNAGIINLKTQKN